VSADRLPVAVPAGAGRFTRLQQAVEHRGFLLAWLSLVAVSIGGLLQIVPLIRSTPEGIRIPGVTPYTALEIAGRDIYVREGCNNCHTQQVRPILGETKRYGAYSRAGEFIYDTPHLWGSKRTGPDLARIGGKYGALWHWKHMSSPPSTSPGSIMPRYPWLAGAKAEIGDLGQRMAALRSVGIPYDDAQIAGAEAAARAQAATIGDELRAQGERPDDASELVALIAYLQRLGRDFKEPVSTVEDKP
jgi:cytochrome c oxidase cbb3-type subunit I/II